jgi:hypothetical protein
VLVYAIFDDRSRPDHPLGDAIETFRPPRGRPKLDRLFSSPKHCPPPQTGTSPG